MHRKRLPVRRGVAQQGLPFRRLMDSARDEVAFEKSDAVHAHREPQSLFARLQGCGRLLAAQTADEKSSEKQRTGRVDEGGGQEDVAQNPHADGRGEHDRAGYHPGMEDEAEEVEIEAS